MYELYEFVLSNLYMYEFILYKLYKKRTNYMNPYVWFCTKISEKKKKPGWDFNPGPIWLAMQSSQRHAIHHPLYELVQYNLYKKCTNCMNLYYTICICTYEFVLYNLYKKRTNHMNPYVWICTKISEKKKKTRFGLQPGTNMACNRRSGTPSNNPPPPLVPILFIP